MLILAVFSSLAWSESFTVNENFVLFESDLANVYSKFGALDFDTIPWCLVESNAGFAFLYCDGLEYSVMFDSGSFLAGKTSQLDVDSNYELLKKITEEEAIPALIQDVRAVGDSVTVISRNTTLPDQAQTMITFYRVGGASSDQMQVKARKGGFLNTHHVISAWGSQRYQLYQLRNLASG